MSEIEILIEKARDTLEAVEILLSHGKFDSAASRTYYAYFYIANALLLHLGFETSRHSQLISQYGLHYSKEKRLDPRFHRLLIEAFELRHDADYEATEPVDEGLLRRLFEEGHRFLAAASEYLQRIADEKDGPDHPPLSESDGREDKGR